MQKGRTGNGLGDYYRRLKRRVSSQCALFEGGAGCPPTSFALVSGRAAISFVHAVD